MQSKSDFWLTLHRLTHDLESEGGTAVEQAASVCQVVDALSADARGVYMSNLQTVLATLVEVQSRCNDDHRK